MKNIKKLGCILIAALILIGGFGGIKIALAINGEGTATIDGGAAGGNVTVTKATSHKFTVVLTVGASGITADAENPTFTIPAGFTAPDAVPVANAGLVVADGDWYVAGGATCVIDSPSVGLTAASGQVITVDVTSACTAGPGGTITLTYQGQSAATMGATALNIGVNASISYAPVVPISSPPTITVTDTSATLNVIKAVTNDNGGAAVASEWTLTVASSNEGSGTGSAVGAESPGTAYTLQAGKAYSVTESDGPSGYSVTATSSECAIESVVAGTTYTCTITSDDIAPQLTVTKTIINLDGGTVSVFPLFIDGFSVTSGVASTTSAGLHIVSETTDSSYTAVIGGECAADGTITLALGDVKACTITNDDIAPVVFSPTSTGGGGVYPYVAPVPPLIDLVKVPSPLALPAGPGLVTYAYTLRNVGTVPVSNITMVGDTCSPIILVSGDVNADTKLDVNEAWTYTCSTTLSATLTNIVTATGWANGISATDIASATVVVGVAVVPPLIHVTKIPNPLTLPAGGGMVSYTNSVTNPGAAPLGDIRLVDDKCSSVVFVSGDTNSDSKLDVGETWKYTCQMNLTKTTTNTVTASGDANGLTARDFAITTVVLATAPVAAVPALPNTGFSSREKSVTWNVIVSAGIFSALILFYFVRRKQTA